MAALVIAASISGCGASTDDIGAVVKESMQETFSSDPDLRPYGLRVTEVTLIHLEGKHYKGMATVVYQGQPRQVTVTVLWDGEYAIWETSADSLLFLGGW